MTRYTTVGGYPNQDPYYDDYEGQFDDMPRSSQAARAKGDEQMTRYKAEQHYSVAGVWQGLWNVVDTETGHTVETHTKEMDARFSAHLMNGGTAD